MVTENLKQHFSLEQGVYLVTGAVNAALYDTNTGDIFSVDKNNRLKLELLLGNGNNETSPLFEINNEPLQRLINYLEENKLGCFFSPEELPKHQLPDPPKKEIRFVWFELTQGCNLKCLHCYEHSGPNFINENKTKKSLADLLSYEQWRGLIDQTAEMGVNAIQFIGGEPLLYNQALDLIKHARERKIKFIELFTNGTLITPPIADQLAGLEAKVALSLYANIPEVHDQITQQQGSFQKTTAAIKHLQERKVPVRVAVIAMSTNESLMEATLNYIKTELGVEQARYDLVRPVGRGENDQLVPKALYEKSISITADFHKVNAPAFARNLYGNSCLNGKLCITPEGNVHPCIMEKDYKIGTVREKSLQEIAQSEELGQIWGLSKDYVDGCSDCEYRYACHDCRPKAKTKENFLAKPQDCLYDPKKGVWATLLNDEKGVLQCP